MKKPHIVIDTSVLIAALRSRRGAAHKLLMLLGTNKFEVSISVPLILEYEDVAKRLIGEFSLTEGEIDDFQGVDQFGIKVITPKELLQKIGELS
jgi:predicted nucleic acid-binding protein